MSAPNLKEIEWAISELEGQESSKGGYSLLAALYICRNEMQKASCQSLQAEGYSEAPVSEPLAQYGDSEFLQVVEGKNPESAWSVMNELMDTLYAVNRRVYDSVMRKLERL